MTGIIIPTQYEASVLLGQLTQRESLGIPGLKAWRGYLDEKEVSIMLCGMGPVHAEERTRQYVEAVRPLRLILAGFAGGLDPKLQLGDVVTAQGNDIVTVMYSSAVVVPDAKAKRALWEKTGCRVVEMEACAVAEVARDEGIPLKVVRVVSDDYDEAIPECLQYGYDMEKGQESPVRMALYLMLHPRSIGTLRLFLKRTGPCSKIVASAVADAVAKTS